MRFKNGGLQLAMSLAFCAPLGAQNPVPVPQGGRVRVSAPSLAARPMVGWVDAVGPTTMTLVVRGDSVVVVPLRAVDRLELSVRRWSRTARIKRAAGIGAIIGVVSGAFVGLVTSGTCSGQFCFQEIQILGYAALGGLALGGVGAVVGATQPTDRWHDWGIDGVDFSPIGTTNQVGRR